MSPRQRGVDWVRCCSPLGLGIAGTATPEWQRGRRCGPMAGATLCRGRSQDSIYLRRSGRVRHWTRPNASLHKSLLPVHSLSDRPSRRVQVHTLLTCACAVPCRRWTLERSFRSAGSSSSSSDRHSAGHYITARAEPAECCSTRDKRPCTGTCTPSDERYRTATGRQTALFPAASRRIIR